MAIRRGDQRLLTTCILIIVAVFAYLLWILIWQGMGSEEWIAAPDTLEVRRSLFGLR